MYNVLVVEDSKTYRELLLEYLRRRGYKVHEAVNGEEALTMLVADPPDLILIDMLMPGLDGIEVLRAMRADAWLARIPVLLLTASHCEKLKLEASSLDAHYLVKGSATIKEICACVQQCLDAGKKDPDVS